MCNKKKKKRKKHVPKTLYEPRVGGRLHDGHGRSLPSSQHAETRYRGRRKEEKKKIRNKKRKKRFQ